MGRAGEVAVWASNRLDGTGLIYSVNNFALSFSDWGDGGRTQAGFRCPTMAPARRSRVLKRLSVDSTMTRPIGPPQPITELGTWEAGLLEGIVGATAEGARAEAAAGG